jgi:hypothetical protein
MKNILVFAGVVTFALAGASHAQGSASSAENGAHFTQSQLKQMQRAADSPEQFKALAAYYAGRQAYYLQQASEEKLEWIRRSQNVMVSAAKYPRPVDSARNLYEYYAYMASEAGSFAMKYGQQAESEPGAQAK